MILGLRLCSFVVEDKTLDASFTAIVYSIYIQRDLQTTKKQMTNILELLKRRKIQRTNECITVDDDGCVTVDLTLEQDIEQSPLPLALEQQQLIPPQQIAPAHYEVSCPVCSLDISQLDITQRESHVELCLLSPSTSTRIFVPSSRKNKQTTKKESNQPKESTEPKEPRPKKPKKPLPQFKIVSLHSHKVIVDGFCYADGPSEKYFLSHFHSDHYIGIVKSWAQGKIYCSDITAGLVVTHLRVPEDRILKIPMNVKFEVEEGLFVTLIDANHCPGAVVFLFESLSEGRMKRVLHTGDFRVSKQLIDSFKDLFIDEIYLDTTYLNPRYTFYDQRLVVNTTVQFIKQCVTEKRRPGILDFVKGGAPKWVVLIGSYSIGKEKIYVELARALNTKVFVTSKRYQTLSLCGFDMSMFEHKDESHCIVHVVNFAKLGDKPWLKRFSNKNIIIIRPTGWSFTRMGKRSKSPTEQLSDDTYMNSILQSLISENQSGEVFEDALKAQWARGHNLQVPYSEHSSFKELSLFATILQWKEIIPTVDVHNEEYSKWFRAWNELTTDYCKVEEHFTSGPA